MKKLLLLFLLLLPHAALAQSTATTVLPGYMGTIGCNGKNSVCYQPSSPPVHSTTTEANHVFKASPGTLFGFSVTVTSTAGYVLLYNSTTAPADGTVAPVACYYISSEPSTVGIAYTPFPWSFSTGITAVFSTTGCTTQTSSSTAWFQAEVL